MRMVSYCHTRPASCTPFEPPWLDDGLDLDLHHRVAMAKAHDLDQHACRAILPEVFETYSGTAIVVVDVRDVSRGTHDVVERRAGVRQAFADVLADLA